MVGHGNTARLADKSVRVDHADTNVGPVGKGRVNLHHLRRCLLFDNLATDGSVTLTARIKDRDAGGTRLIRLESDHPMKALLIRVAVDQAYGEWNAPVDPATGRFVYVPIPESVKTVFHPGCDRPYTMIIPALQGFCREHSKTLDGDLKFPAALTTRSMHLDPDFGHLTYGDNGGRRGAGIVGMAAGDLLVFYAGLRPIRPCEHRLVYAMVGLYVVDEVLPVSEVPKARWDDNAHTRKATRGPTDLVVRARREVSGRLDRSIPIGEWRDGSYRVRRDLLETWGGLSVKDGFIQRSAVPPAFLQPAKFYDWFLSQGATLTARDNPDSATEPAMAEKIFLIQLRRPIQDPSEARSDPYWEFGSFGCTGCHSSNLFNPRHADRLRGARLGFVQGGPKGSRLVFLTPPITVTEWADRCEARWQPAEMPYCYDVAPVLAANDRPSDFPLIEALAGATNCGTIEGGLSSRFRTRAKPLLDDQAAELIAVYNRSRAAAAPGDIASRYEQALPWMPPNVDSRRGTTYRQRIRELKESAGMKAGACRRRPPGFPRRNRATNRCAK